MLAENLWERAELVSLVEQNVLTNKNNVFRSLIQRDMGKLMNDKERWNYVQCKTKLPSSEMLLQE